MNKKSLNKQIIFFAMKFNCSEFFGTLPQTKQILIESDKIVTVLTVCMRQS